MDRKNVKRYFSDNASDWVDYGHNKIGNNYPVGKHRNRIVRKILKESSSVKNILDIGCGGGDLCLELSVDGYNVSGIDESLEMINIAKNRANDESLNINFIEMSLQDLKSTREQFDAIVSLGVIGYLESDDELFSVVSKKLPKGGKFIVSSRNRLFNLYPTSKYFREEVNSGDINILLDEIDEIKNNVYIDDIAMLSDAIDSINLTSYNVNGVKEEPEIVPAALADERFISKIRQHTPKGIVASADKFRFKRTNLIGVHPHLLPSILNEKLPTGVYNEISSILEVWETFPISVLWSSVFITVFEKC